MTYEGILTKELLDKILLKISDSYSKQFLNKN